MNDIQLEQTTSIAPIPNRSVQMMPANPTPGDMLAYALANGADLDRLERLMAMKREWDATEARKDYVAAMSRFQANAPTILKDKHVSFTTGRGTTEYDHATLGNIVKQIIAGLSANGLTHAWSSTQEGKSIRVTCTITHVSGHSESIWMESQADDSGGKNSIQAIGSAVTYLQRYTLLMLTGLASEFAQKDDDGRKGGGDAAEQALLSEFQEAAMNGETALRKHYEDNTPSAKFWAEHSKSLKDAARKADKDKVPA